MGLNSLPFINNIILNVNIITNRNEQLKNMLLQNLFLLTFVSSCSKDSQQWKQPLSGYAFEKTSYIKSKGIKF